MNVGTVNGHVTRCAALIVRIDLAVRRMVRIGDATVRSTAKIAIAGVALQTKCSRCGSGQKLGIGGSVRLVASDAAIHLPRLVFEDKRPASLHVALEARLLTAVCLVQHLRGLSHAESGCEAAMRVVTIAARHEAFIDPVLAGQVELRPHVRVAFVTGLRLAFGEQVLVRCRTVNRMGAATLERRPSTHKFSRLGAIDLFSAIA